MGKRELVVAEALGRAHVALLEDLRKLMEAARPGSGTGLAELQARLAATQAHVTRHFRFEEQNGYLEVVRKREPRLERAIEQLAEEHRQLAQSLERLIAQAGAATRMDDSLATAVRDWVERLRQHEIRETEIVQDAFNLELGAED